MSELTMTDEERCRAEFEKEEKNWLSEGTDEDGDYIDTWVQNRWIGWKACWKLCGGMK